MGYVVSLTGFAWYNQIKMTQIASGTNHGPQGQADGGKGGDQRKP